MQTRSNAMSTISRHGSGVAGTNYAASLIAEFPTDYSLIEVAEPLPQL